ncbi:hypothetical protein CBL_05052 [Carabus blaptoides fortunei]
MTLSLLLVSAGDSAVAVGFVVPFFLTSEESLVAVISANDLPDTTLFEAGMVDVNIVLPVAPTNEEAENNSADTVTAIIAGPSNIINETPCTRPTKRNRSIERLENSVVATNKLAEQLDKKIKRKEDYYKKKLILLERKVLAKERIAEAKEKIADTLQQVVSATYPVP